MTSAKTVNGARVRIKVKGSSVYLNSTRKVLKTDVKASNGIIHVINGVLLPPSK
ncbi:MAG: fasciclin domain-containing protein [Solirubrobacteraceae bacterium]